MKPVKHTGGQADLHNYGSPCIQINEEHHEKCSINTGYKIKTKALINIYDFFYLCRRIFNLLIYEILTLYNACKYFFQK